MSTADFHAANPHIPAPPSPRERLAALRQGLAVCVPKGDTVMAERFADRRWALDLADILLDAIEAR